MISDDLDYLTCQGAGVANFNNSRVLRYQDLVHDERARVKADVKRELITKVRKCPNLLHRLYFQVVCWVPGSHSGARSARKRAWNKSKIG